MLILVIYSQLLGAARPGYSMKYNAGGPPSDSPMAQAFPAAAAAAAVVASTSSTASSGLTSALPDTSSSSQKEEPPDN